MISENSDEETVVAPPLPYKNIHKKDEAQTPGFVSPFEWPKRRKWLTTVLGACCAFTVTFASSVFSSAIVVTAQEFNVSETVMLLGIALFVMGFAAGPFIWGPLSEVYGRKHPLFVGYFMFMLMQIPLALAPNLYAIFISRFLAGAFGASPMVLVSAMYADFWEPAPRGVASAVYSIATFSGPTLGPVIGSFLTESYLGWRWTAWITLIMAGTVLPPAFFFIPESWAPLLKEQASKKAGYGTVPMRTTSSMSREAAKNFLQKFIFKPAIMIALEPMLLFMTLYTSVAYGIMYLTFFAFPYAFTVEREWAPHIGSLAFLSILVGVLAACASIAIYTKVYYIPRLRRRGKMIPEDRLPLIMAGGFLLPVGLFWFAWTSSPHITWVPQVLSGCFIGAGTVMIFASGVAFIIDCYLSSAASALAALTTVRSFVAAGLPLAGPTMYKNLGTAWATSLLGFCCVALIPVPVLFYKYGARMRAASKFAPTTS